MNKTSMTTKTTRKSLCATAAGLGLMFAATVPAATLPTENMVNTVTVIDSCYVLATGVNFGTITTPMVADIPGTLPNLNDTGTITVNVPVVGNVNVLTVSEAGVNVVCSKVPSSILLTLGGGESIDLRNAAVATDTISGVMNGSNGGTIDYEIGFLAVETPTLLNSVVAVYAGVFAVNPLATKVPQQELDGGAGVYTDTATVVVTY